MDMQMIDRMFENRLHDGGGEYEREFSLGKVDCFGTGRKANEATMKVSLRKREQGIEFSASADVWNHMHTDIYMGGQCVDEVVKLLEDAKAPEYTLKTARFICDMWEKYHLNDMHAGTPAQEAILKEAVKNGELERYGANNYEETCNYLKERGMLVDKDYTTEKFPNGYRYGCGWLFEAIPEEDLSLIKEFMVTGEVPEGYGKDACIEEQRDEEEVDR